jgi:hypothetical protein
MTEAFRRNITVPSSRQATQPVCYILVTLKFCLLYFRECLCVNKVLLPHIIKTYYTVYDVELCFELLAFKVDS